MEKIERIKDKIIVALVFIVAIILAVLLLTSCGEGHPSKNIAYGYKIIVIDSCEYIQYSYGFAHKGNCRFCLERNKKLIKEQLDSTLIEIFD